MKVALKTSDKSVLMSFKLTTDTSVLDARTWKQILGSGMTTIIIWYEAIDDIMKIVKSLEESHLLIKGVRKSIKNK